MCNANNATLDDKTTRMTLVGFEKCQECGYEYAEIWKDDTGSNYVRCSHFNCGNSGTLIRK